MTQLVILPNVGKFAETNTWHQEVLGVKLLTNTVNTVRRVGLVKEGDEHIPPSMMKVKQLLLLHSTGEEVAPGVRTKTSNPIYKNVEGGSMTHELRGDGSRHGATLPKGYVGETTFKFKFAITCAKDIAGGDANTLLRLRYSVVDHPEIFVDTEPFRLVAKEDKTRVGRATAANAMSAASTGKRKSSSNLPSALRHLIEARRMLEAEMDTLGNAADAPQEALRDCTKKITYMVTQINELSSVPSITVQPAPLTASAARDDAPTPDTTMEDEPQNWSEDEFNGAINEAIIGGMQQARSSPLSAEAEALHGVIDILDFMTDEEPSHVQLRSLGSCGGMTTAQQQPKRPRLVDATAALYDDGGEPMAFRSCAAPDDGDDAPPMMRGLSDVTVAAPPPPPRTAAVPAIPAIPAMPAVPAAPTPLPVQRLQALLRGAWRQASSDSPSAKVRARLAAIVLEVLSRHKAKQAFDLAETLDELNDLKAFLDFNTSDNVIA